MIGLIGALTIGCLGDDRLEASKYLSAIYDKQMEFDTTYFKMEYESEEEVKEQEGEDLSGTMTGQKLKGEVVFQGYNQSKFKGSYKAKREWGFASLEDYEEIYGYNGNGYSVTRGYDNHYFYSSEDSYQNHFLTSIYNKMGWHHFGLAHIEWSRASGLNIKSLIDLLNKDEPKDGKGHSISFSQEGDIAKLSFIQEGKVKNKEFKQVASYTFNKHGNVVEHDSFLRTKKDGKDFLHWRYHRLAKDYTPIGDTGLTYPKSWTYNYYSKNQLRQIQKGKILSLTIEDAKKYENETFIPPLPKGFTYRNIKEINE